MTDITPSSLQDRFAEALAKLRQRAAEWLGNSESGDSILDAIRAPYLIGSVIIFLFFGVLGLWAATAPLTGGAVAPGVVSPDGSRRIIQHLEGGIISSFAVDSGDIVEVGQPLVVLKDTQARASYDLVLGQHRMLSAMLARLTAERTGSSEITWPDDLMRDRNLPEVARILEAQQALFETRRVNLENRRNILRQRIAQLDEEISGLTSLIASETRQLELIEDEMESVKTLVRKGLERKPRLLALQRAAAEIDGSRASNQAAVARSKQAIGEAELQIINLESEQLDKVAEQLTQTRAELSTLEEKLLATQDVFERIVIRAPIAGTVVNKRFKTVGGVVGPGDPILDIVPLEEELLIDARVSPIDIDVVHPDLKAQVHLSAFAQRNLPQIRGRVRSVSADALQDEQTGERYYTARVEVDRAQLDEIAEETGQDLTLYPGMPAEVLIVTGERTMLGYLFQPLADSLRRAFR